MQQHILSGLGRRLLATILNISIKNLKVIGRTWIFYFTFGQNWEFKVHCDSVLIECLNFLMIWEVIINKYIINLRLGSKIGGQL